MLAYNEVIQKQWQVETKMHSKQTDGYNCGVRCLLTQFMCSTRAFRFETSADSKPIDVGHVTPSKNLRDGLIDFREIFKTDRE
uniref:Uncharacterized protein n=1 Tax=Magallana gigas TaxID=29159 RepID=K1RZG8_MAGGI